MLRLRSIPGLGAFAFALMVLILPPAAAADSIELDGLIEPSLIVKVGSHVAGILESIKVDRGDMVRKGEVLATLKSGVERATMELARTRAEMESDIKAKEARLKFSVRRQKRMEELFKKKVVHFEEMDESRTNSEMALMELEEAKDNKRLAEMELKRSIELFERMTIYSPIKGVVVERFLSPGEYVEDQPILQLAQIHPLYVEVFAPVELLGTIKVGMSAKVRPEKPIGNVYKARVKIVDRVVDAASSTFGVRLQLPNPDYRLPAGLKCKVTFLFDISAIEKKIEASKKDDPGKPGKGPASEDSATLKDKTKLEFYEALKENSEDTKVPALQTPKITEQKIEKPAEKPVSQKPQKTTPKEPTSAKAVSQKAESQRSKPATASQKDASSKKKVATVKKTAAAGPVYTIQAASVKNPKDADRLIQKLKKSGYPAYRTIGKVPGKGIWFRVRIGEYKSKSEALGVIKKLNKDGLKPILVMK